MQRKVLKVQEQKKFKLFVVRELRKNKIKGEHPKKLKLLCCEKSQNPKLFDEAKKI